MLRFTALVTLLGTSACMVGGTPPEQIETGDEAESPDTSSDDPGTTPSPGGEPDEPEPVIGTIAVSADEPGAELTLGTEDVLVFTVASIDGYSGDVGLSVTGAPESWTIEVLPEVLSLSADQAASLSVRVQVPTDGDAGAHSLDLHAVPLGQARDSELTAAATVDVDNTYYASLPLGTQVGTHPWPTISLRLGATIVFGSDDIGTAHRIHSGNDDLGFPHQGDQLINGNTYTVTPTGTGTLDYYCHEHGTGTGIGRLTVVD